MSEIGFFSCCSETLVLAGEVADQALDIDFPTVESAGVDFDIVMSKLRNVRHERKERGESHKCKSLQVFGFEHEVPLVEESRTIHWCWVFFTVP